MAEVQEFGLEVYNPVEYILNTIERTQTFHDCCDWELKLNQTLEQNNQLNKFKNFSNQLNLSSTPPDWAPKAPQENFNYSIKFSGGRPVGRPVGRPDGTDYEYFGGGNFGGGGRGYGGGDWTGDENFNWGEEPTGPTFGFGGFRYFCL